MTKTSTDAQIVGSVSFINGDAQQFTDAKAFLDCLREELPYRATTGFRFRTITQDPAVRKAVDDIVHDFYGEENPCCEEDYMQSVLTNTIYADELKEIYVQKDVAYKEVPEAARTAMHGLVDRMESVSEPPASIQQKLLELALELRMVGGKKQYGYLKKSLKDKVDEIVDELEKLPEVAAYYSVWNGLRDTLEGYYKNRPRQHNPLSQQKEFRAIKTAIIQEAERLRQQMEQESLQDEEPSAENTSTDASANPTLADENTSSTASQDAQFPSEYLLNSTIRLFHQMGQIFRDNAAPPSNPMGMLVNKLDGTYQQLCVSPFGIKEMLLQNIDRQIALGQSGYVCIKANSVTEREVIDKLAAASRAGVEIQLIIRGICCILPGVVVETENIHVTSVVGRFLEHGRIYQFGRDENAEYYISSADLMTRNLNSRVEIACPVHDMLLREQLRWILDSQLRDTAKAGLLLPDGSYCRKHSAVPFDSQDYFIQQSPHISAQPVREAPRFLQRLKELMKGVPHA